MDDDELVDEGIRSVAAETYVLSQVFATRCMEGIQICR